MSLSLTCAFVWLIAANLRAMFPSKDNLWTFAYVMIALGVPIVIGVAIQHNIWLALVLVGMGAWIMRWPVIYLWRWVKGKIE
ncbi:DUF2484 family protein [Shimia sp. R9_3]|uniref:DUF2484 family protein n=1 Tax=Shimia sp. R9_3 TaxID=2821113 RepID=UPI001ADAC4A3|nr:DUF2484 family protein [Shimia sp. R9_3]MBO9402133.1 DUF2484 family protein [Shimia sp. R9_3]